LGVNSMSSTFDAAERILSAVANPNVHGASFVSITHMRVGKEPTS